MTLLPSAANRRAMASPMPRFPPVTSTERPMLASFQGSLRVRRGQGASGGWGGSPQERGGLGVVRPG